jgi:hypothetical protein
MKSALEIFKALQTIRQGRSPGRSPAGNRRATDQSHQRVSPRSMLLARSTGSRKARKSEAGFQAIPTEHAIPFLFPADFRGKVTVG